MLSTFIYKIKNRENAFFNLLFVICKALMGYSFPCIKPLHRMLWWERVIRGRFWRWLLRFFYYTPMFKSICSEVGERIILLDGIPYTNENLTIKIGDNVRIHGTAGFTGFKAYKKPLLKIGSGTYIGPDVRIGIGKEVSIGSNCLIAARVFIADHDGHSLNPVERRENLQVNKEAIKPIIIEDDAWLGEGVFICKGVTIGAGAVVAARSVVTKSVLPLTVVAGNPAKVITKIVL